MWKRGKAVVHSLADFAARVNPRAIKSASLKPAAAGAFDALDSNRAGLAGAEAILAACQRSISRTVGQNDMFGVGDAPTIMLPQAEPWLRPTGCGANTTPSDFSSPAIRRRYATALKRLRAVHGEFFRAGWKTGDRGKSTTVAKRSEPRCVAA